MSKRLRVAVPEALFEAVTMTGRGRMWHEVLLRLSATCDIQPSTAGSAGVLRRRIGPRPDVWLFDGHGGPLPVSEPQVIQLHEAPWTEDETVDTLDPAFLAAVVDPSRRAARAAAAIVCPSYSAKSQIVADSNISADKVFVAHHGVDHDVFQPGLARGAEIAVSHGSDSALPYILTVASLHPRKNLPALCAAVLQLATESFPHQLVVVGAPAYGRTDDERLRAKLKAYGADRIVLVPFGLTDADIAALMCGAAAFCLPSLSEGFGLPAAEAMACATPTVLSSRGALTEIGRGAAVMVEPTPHDIAAGLRTILTDPAVAARVGLACAHRAASFDWDTCASQWLVALHAGVAHAPSQR